METSKEMSEDQEPSSEQLSYWREFVQLKIDAYYVRDYRNSLGLSERRVAAIRAIASSASIGAWAIWKQYALVWALLIAASQVADALKDVFPFRRKRQALSKWCNALNNLFVLAQRDWDDISRGNLTDEQIRKLTHQLRLKKQKLEARYIPDGLPEKEKLFQRAENQVVKFFQARYLE